MMLRSQRIITSSAGEAQMVAAFRPVPCRLDEGVALEDSGLLIGWGTPVTGLVTFELPAVTRHPNSVHIYWRGRRCLGGLPCDIGACRVFETPNPRAYQIYLAEFHWARLDPKVAWGESDA